MLGDVGSGEVFNGHGASVLQDEKFWRLVARQCQLYKQMAKMAHFMFLYILLQLVLFKERNRNALGGESEGLEIFQVKPYP